MRKFFRSILANTPFFGIAQSVYIFSKRALDYLFFKITYPQALWIIFNDMQIKNHIASASKSQFGQDIFLDNLFRKLKGSSFSGYFVDIGANHPTFINNSYMLEKNGWSGIAIDPLKSFIDDWKRERSTPLINIAVSSELGSRDFVQILSKDGWEHTLSGFADCVRQADVDLYGCSLYKVETAPLNKILIKNQCVDLLMIDVEGAEEYVIQGATLNETRPTVVMIENVGAIGGKNSIRKIMSSNGYILHASIGATDDVYIINGTSIKK